MREIQTVNIAGQEWVLVKRTPREGFGALTAKTMEQAGIIARLTVRRQGGRTLYHVNDYAAAGLGPPRRAM